MKIDYDMFGNFEFTPEDGRDHLFLAEMIQNVNSNSNKDANKHFDSFFTTDYESGCILEDNSPAEEMFLNEVLDEQGKVWGEITKVRFSPFGN